MSDRFTHQLAFAQFAGDLAATLSFNRSVGQIYGLLYTSASPLSLSEIADLLKMSKGSVSLNIRILEGWGAVRRRGVKGSRQDYYEANTNLQQLISRRVQEGLGRRLDMAEESLNRLAEQVAQKRGPEPAQVQRRLQELRGLVGKTRKALQLLPKLSGLIPGL